MFAVGQVVKCVSAFGTRPTFLELGKVYRVEDSKQALVQVRNERGLLAWYDATRFREVTK